MPARSFACHAVGSEGLPASYGRFAVLALIDR